MRNKIIDFHKIFKKIDNITFWVFTFLAFVLFFGSIIFIWIKYSSIAELNLLTNEIKDIFSKLVLVNIVVYSLVALINLYHFNNALPKIIKKDHLVSINVTKSILLICSILLFISSKVFFRLSNLVFDDYFLKTTYVMLHLTSLIGSVFLFYFFSFLTTIAEDETVTHAPYYTYKMKKLTYEEIKNLILKRLESAKLEQGSYYDKDFTISYYISHEEREYVYAFLHLSKIEYDFVKIYANERITPFVEYLYTKILNKEKNVSIIYFICVDSSNEDTIYLAETSSYHDEHFAILHMILDLSKNELLISSVRENDKKDGINYVDLKNRVDKIVVDIVKNSQFGKNNLNTKEKSSQNK